MAIMVTTVRDVIDRDLDRKIEEIVKVGQDDVETVYNEITEYVATDHINKEYRDLFAAIAQGPQRPDEGVGVWVSGFFGSGKSSFAKNLGYALRNPNIAGTPAGQLLAEQLRDPEIARLIDFVSHSIKTTVVMFDVTSERSVRTNNERIAEIVYNVLLRELGYPEDWTLANLELNLEDEGRLDQFLDLMYQEFGRAEDGEARRTWSRIARGPQALNRASAILHRIDPATFPAVDTWAQTVRGTEPRLDVGQIVARTFDLMRRRRPGEALTIVVDEVGQYVGRSGEKIEDLRALVEQFGKESANRVKRRQFPAPVWIVVTSQEKLDEVVSALDEGRNLLPKLMDRFHHRVDLVPSDIREVATKRVLGKTAEGTEQLRRLFAVHGGRLQSYTEFERSTRRTDLTEEGFAQFYPFLPHFIDLSIDVVTGLRARSSGFRQTGAANRTIIKQAHEMLVGEPRLADEPLGTLVTLDKVYDLVRHSSGLDQNHKIELDRIRQEFSEGSWEERVTKALALLELVRNLPRTEKNIAAVLYDRLGAESPLPQVRAALENLGRGQYVREAEDGWKLQTAEEKEWDRERRGLDPRPKDRNEAIREAIAKAFADHDLRTYKHRGRSFKVGLTAQIGPTGIEAKLGDEGQLAIKAQAVEPGDSLDALKTASQDTTRDPRQKNTLIWTFALDQEIDDLARDLLRSRAMVVKYDSLAAQGKIQQEEKALLQDEKNQERRLAARLVEKVALAIHGGTGFHAGNTYDGGDLGGTLGEAVRRFLERTTPQIFPQLATAPLTGKEAERLLTEANLTNVPTVLHAEADGLGLVVKRDGHYVVDDQGRLPSEVLRYLAEQKDYGETKTGKEIAERFGAPPYGWDPDTVRVVLAALLRGGKIAVTHNGRLLKSHQDPAARVPLTNLTAFRTATFEPRASGGLSLGEQSAAVMAYEDLTGSTLDIDPETIAGAFRQYAGRELVEADKADTIRSANGLPEDSAVSAYCSLLASVATIDTEDAVRALAGAGKTLKDGRDAVHRIKGVVETQLEGISQARTVLNQMWPVVQAQSGGSTEVLTTAAADLRALLGSPDLYSHPLRAQVAGKRIETAFRSLYLDLHARRASQAAAAIEAIKAMPEWTVLQPADAAEREARAADRHDVLGALDARACPEPDLPPGATVCRACLANVGQLQSDLLAVDGLRQSAVTALRAIVRPPVETVYLRARDLAAGPIASKDDLQQVQDELALRVQVAFERGAVVVLE